MLLLYVLSVFKFLLVVCFVVVCVVLFAFVCVCFRCFGFAFFVLVDGTAGGWWLVIVWEELCPPHWRAIKMKGRLLTRAHLIQTRDLLALGFKINCVDFTRLCC